MMKKKRTRPSFFNRVRIAGAYIFNAQRFDNARNDNHNMWKDADSLSIDQATNSWTRETLRNRARYVVVNNAFAANGVNAICNAVVGTAPRLQLTSKNLSDNELATIESAFSAWATEIRLAEKLRQMVFAKIVDGEAFATLCKNEKLENAVKLDVMLFDADRVCGEAVDNSVDGVYINAIGEATAYRVLKSHPAEGLNRDAVRLNANRVVHLFRRQFPEQHRGITQLQPALELFQLLDRYSKATVLAAESAADMALVFHTDQLEDYGVEEQDDVAKKPFAEMSYSRGSTLTLPEGWNATQIKAEQPVSTYSTFVSSVLNQIGAAVGVPKILLQASAEQSNYSSARLDLQSFNAQCRIDREQLVNVVLRPIFRLWLSQYATIVGKELSVSFCFYFDNYISIDPQKEADASKIRLENNLSTLAYEYGRMGMDWEEQLTQKARELVKMKELGLVGESQ